jgi:DNA-binding NtrC family response regulator
VPLGQGETLLVVEDNPDARMAMREALAVYEQRRDEIALVVSDVVMPEMGGVALVHALLAQNPEIKVVLVSGHAQQSEVEKLPSMGSIAWEPKPPTPDRLAHVIARLLQGKGTE